MKMICRLVGLYNLKLNLKIIFQYDPLEVTL